MDTLALHVKIIYSGMFCWPSRQCKDLIVHYTKKSYHTLSFILEITLKSQLFYNILSEVTFDEN